MDFLQFMGYLCTGSSVCFQFVGLQICWNVVKKGGTGEMSPFTFITYFTSACVWLKYGLIKKLPVVIGVNALSASLNLVYIIIFYRYTLRKTQFNQYMMVGFILLLTPLVYVKYYQTDMKLVIHQLGFYSVLLSVVGYAAPLTSLRDVIRTRSVECLSFPLILANFIVAVEWTIYGGLLKDTYVQAPNFLGAVLAVIQLSLFFLFPGTSLKGSTVHV